jgi:exosortase K
MSSRFSLSETPVLRTIEGPPSIGGPSARAGGSRFLGDALSARAYRSLWLIDVATLLVALGLKARYSRADVTDLRWILAPTAAVVGWLRREPLVLDAQFGWTAPDGSFVIAPACAGVNFLILVFAVCVLGFVGRFRSARQRWGWFILAAGGVYLLTIAVNALRIVVAVNLYRMEIHAGWFTPQRVHRLAGTMIYLAGLWTAWLGADLLSARLQHSSTTPGRVPAFVLPAAYICTAVVEPWLNGAWRHFGDRYLEHAVTVSLLAVGTVPLLSLMRWATSWSRSLGEDTHGQTDDSGGRGRANDC